MPDAASCYTCDQEADLDACPVSERIWVGEWWRVAHAFDSSLPGWLVVIPRRHVETIADLTFAESTELGEMLREASRALTTVLGCPKTYVMQFAEAAGFGHVHFHVVARPEDLPAEHRGPRIFHYLGASESERIPQDEIAALADQLHDAMATDGDFGEQPWYAVRSVLRTTADPPDHPGEVADGESRYEERITAWRASSFAEAVEKAEVEAREYAAHLDGTTYVDFAQAFQLFDRPGEGAEVFSLIRRSRLEPDEYIDHFFDPGEEYQRDRD